MGSYVIKDWRFLKRTGFSVQTVIMNSVCSTYLKFVRFLVVRDNKVLRLENYLLE